MARWKALTAVASAQRTHVPFDCRARRVPRLGGRRGRQRRRGKAAMAAAASSSVAAVESTPSRPLASRSIAPARAQRQTHTRRRAHTPGQVTEWAIHAACAWRQAAGGFEAEIYAPVIDEGREGLVHRHTGTLDPALCTAERRSQQCDGSHVVEVPLLAKLHCWRAYEACQ